MESKRTDRNPVMRLHINSSAVTIMFSGSEGTDVKIRSGTFSRRHMRNASRKSSSHAARHYENRRIAVLFLKRRVAVRSISRYNISTGRGIAPAAH